MSHSAVIKLKSLRNTRDLGGIQTLDGRKIKSNRIIRSGNLFNASYEDMKTLRDNYHLHTVIDLRTEHEKNEKPDFKIEGVNYVANPILTEAQMGITREEQVSKKSSNLKFVSQRIKENNAFEFMRDIYINFVDNSYCLSQYSAFIRLLLANNDGASLYHCSVGKDRVGIATYIILSLLNVDEKDIVEDFMLTNYLIEDDVVKEINELRNDIKDQRLEETFRTLFQVQKEYIEAIIDYINKNYGSFYDFRKNILKITDNEVKKFQEMYLE